MLTREDVVDAYRFLLLRDPESDDIIRQWISVAADRNALLVAIVGSEEFGKRVDLRSLNPRPRLSDRLPASPIQTEATEHQLASLFARIQAEWKMLGESEPHWSVVTDDRYKSTTLASNVDDFYATGSHDYEKLTAWLGRHNIDIHSFKRCFELGCGVGRVTEHLAKQFPEVIGADISPAHIEIAKSRLTATGRPNCSFVALRSITDLQQIRDYDFFYSFIVFQHNPPPVQAWMLKTILSNMNSGGVAFFQIPTYYASYSFDVDRYLSGGFEACVKERATGAIEVHPLPQKAIFSICAAAGADVLEVREDECIGAEHAVLSNSFLIRKR
jgi:2-polyprenyl-3-methyl-5-hydroxy-6-metoxy-1,4-benzoquinol methylase